MNGAFPIGANVGALSNRAQTVTSPRTAGLGGGYTVVAASYVMGGTTAASLRLLKGTESNGTFTANGTLDSAAVGGTADLWVVGVRKTPTLGSSCYVAPGEVLAVIEGNVQAAAVATLVQVWAFNGK